MFGLFSICLFFFFFFFRALSLFLVDNDKFGSMSHEYCCILLEIQTALWNTTSFSFFLHVVTYTDLRHDYQDNVEPISMTSNLFGTHFLYIYVVCIKNIAIYWPVCFFCLSPVSSYSFFSCKETISLFVFLTWVQSLSV